MRQRRALISVSDRSGIVGLAKALVDANFAVVSTGGTAKVLRDNGMSVRDVSEVTGYPELMDGRIKTLHPSIHAGILALRENPEHIRQLRENDISEIDVVVVNLYPFKETIRKAGVGLNDAIENIDIGGVALLRAAAKNYRSVSVIVDPADYDAIIAELRGTGTIDPDTRARLAIKAFQHTSDYDHYVAGYLENEITGPHKFPSILRLRYEKVEELRYGENPHQAAAAYSGEGNLPVSVLTARKLQGKALSYNNIVDLDSALDLLRDFEEPTAVIIKHTNPCGVASGSNAQEAYARAYECDTASAYGGVICINCELDKETAQLITQRFFEAVIAPGIEGGSLQVLAKKKNLTVLDLGRDSKVIPQEGLEVRNIAGGILLQENDTSEVQESGLRYMTPRRPDEEEIKDLLFAWKVAKHVKSNAIVLAKGMQTIGIGAGQMSRIDSAKIAITKAGKRTMGSCMASDGFIPFRDTVDEAARAGVKSIIQPGGSIRDEEVIKSASDNDIAMVFTGMRCFRH
jgi:phosphoribosylaminoimidazolecarboxamide formyltransferase/IMP cyclohydrolase